MANMLAWSIPMDFSEQTIADLQSLLDDVYGGNEAAFNSLVGRVDARMRELTHRMLRQYPGVRRWEDTDDVFQSALIRLHRSLDATQPESVRGFLGLAVTQIRRTLIDLSRHYFGIYGKGSLHHSDAQGRAADDPGAALDGVAAGKQFSQPVSLDEWTTFHQATTQLPDQEREVFDLAWYAGLPQSEIARLLGVSQRTVIRRLHRARTSLRQMLVDNDTKPTATGRN